MARDYSFPERTAITFELPDVYHAFRRGHRLMVQVQSSWFPLVDRNPQRFMDIPKARRADFQKASTHPLRFGRMSCSDCHNAHGSTNAALLVKPTLNQTCFSCHAEKRGPVLWEHAPVAEDCSLCHSSHGSNRSALLTKSPPLLCQQCHSVAGHPAVARTPGALPGGGAGGSIFLVAGSCTNCHTQTHGSNHPAGAKLMR